MSSWISSVRPSCQGTVTSESGSQDVDSSTRRRRTVSCRHRELSDSPQKTRDQYLLLSSSTRLQDSSLQVVFRVDSHPPSYTSQPLLSSHKVWRNPPPTIHQNHASFPSTWRPSTFCVSNNCYFRLTEAGSPGTKYYLNGVTDEHAIRFHEHYKLDIEREVFIRGVLAMRHRIQLEQMLKSDHWRGIKIADYEFTDLEFKILKRTWTRGRKDTLRHLSRLHWILIVACVFAAMTQGWDQAAMAGMALLWPSIRAATATDRYQGPLSKS